MRLTEAVPREDDSAVLGADATLDDSQVLDGYILARREHGYLERERNIREEVRLEIRVVEVAHLLGRLK